MSTDFTHMVEDILTREAIVNAGAYKGLVQAFNAAQIALASTDLAEAAEVVDGTTINPKKGASHPLPSPEARSGNRRDCVMVPLKRLGVAAQMITCKTLRFLNHLTGQ